MTDFGGVVGSALLDGLDDGAVHGGVGAALGFVLDCALA